MRSVSGESARRKAFRILMDYDRGNAYLNNLLFSALLESELDRRDKALVTEIVQGTVRMKTALDHALGQFSDRNLDALDPGVLWILRASAYQLLFTSIPAYAVCDTGSGITQREVGRSAVGFVNGVLRAMARGLEQIDWPDRERDPAGYMEVRLSHPRWVIEMWTREFGFEKAELLCAADNRQPRLSLRCNLLKTTREELSRVLREKGIEAEPGELAPEALLVRGGGPLQELTGYRTGMFSVQDQGSMVACRCAAVRPGMRVLDMCAAPGGKANHLAELMHNEGSVLALDVNPNRLKMVIDGAQRLGNTIVEARALDATKAAEELSGTFERVLIDAPCTGLGTLARRPDVRWRKSPGDVDRLSALQLTLLDEGSRLVAPGGLLIYSTCTISRAENQDLVSSFLRSRGDFEPVENVQPSKEKEKAYVQLFPDTDGCDGMFIAVLKRIG